MTQQIKGRIEDIGKLQSLNLEPVENGWRIDVARWAMKESFVAVKLDDAIKILAREAAITHKKQD